MSDEIIVAGAGPAGTLTAILLARRGYAVVLLSGGRAQPRIEGLSQRVVDVLHAHGLARAAAAVGPEVPRLALWNGERGPRNTEYATARLAFDAALRADAAAAGVRCLPVRKLAIRLAGAQPHISVETATGKPQEFTGSFFIEARGRAAPSPRARATTGPATTALISAVQGASGQPATCVESFDDGWAWYVCDGETAFLQIFLDSSEGLPKRSAMRALFDDAADRLVLAPELIGAGRLRGRIMTRHTTPRLAGTVVTEKSIRVGDAASAVDPLSGHGVFAAFGSALAASAAIHTILTRPNHTALARRFYNERTQLGFERFARIGRDFYRLESRWKDRAFWRDRARWPDDAPAHGTPIGAPVRIERRPVVADGLVVERRVAVTSDQPRGIWRIDDVPLADLVDRLREGAGASLPDLVPAVARDLTVEEGQLNTALDWLRSRRVLADGTRIALNDAMLNVID